MVTRIIMGFLGIVTVSDMATAHQHCLVDARFGAAHLHGRAGGRLSCRDWQFDRCRRFDRRQWADTAAGPTRCGNSRFASQRHACGNPFRDLSRARACCGCSTSNRSADRDCLGAGPPVCAPVCRADRHGGDRSDHDLRHALAPRRVGAHLAESRRHGAELELERGRQPHDPSLHRYNGVSEPSWSHGASVAGLQARRAKAIHHHWTVQYGGSGRRRRIDRFCSHHGAPSPLGRRRTRIQTSAISQPSLAASPTSCSDWRRLWRPR